MTRLPLHLITRYRLAPTTDTSLSDLSSPAPITSALPLSLSSSPNTLHPRATHASCPYLSFLSAPPLRFVLKSPLLFLTLFVSLTHQNPTPTRLLYHVYLYSSLGGTRIINQSIYRICLSATHHHNSCKPSNRNLKSSERASEINLLLSTSMHRAERSSLTRLVLALFPRSLHPSVRSVFSLSQRAIKRRGPFLPAAPPRWWSGRSGVTFLALTHRPYPDGKGSRLRENELPARNRVMGKKK